MSEGSDPYDAHQLLLQLAGRLDDDLLAWARELVAVGEEGQAVELAVAALVAEQVALPEPLRAALVRSGHTDLDADASLAPATPDVTGHRFDAAAGSGDRVAAVLAALPARRLAGCTLHLTWRLTPAGAVPGPVPRAVVLVETGPDRSADVLAYLLTTELERAGVPASVEVFTAGTDLPAYHATALRSARRIEVGASVIAPAGVVVARTAAERAEPAPPDAGTDTAALLVMPSDPGEARRAGRRRKREPAAVAPEPVAPRGPDDAPDTDPFEGPLRVPLLAPLLDPTEGSAPPAVPTPIRPVPAQPAADEPSVAAEPEVAEPAPTDGTSPVEVPDEVPQEWEDDWRSGDWAMPPGGPSFDVFETPDTSAVEETGRTELPTRAAPELPTRTRRVEEPFSSGDPGDRPAPTDVSLFDSPTARVSSVPGEALFGEPRLPPDQGGRRRRPDADPEPVGDAERSVLNSTERDLLAQLQAELADRERRPRPYRRARSTAAPGVNGHGANGHGANGHEANGHEANGHDVDGPGPDDPEGPGPR